MSKWLKSSECILFSVVEKVATITLNRPDKRNAISQVLLREFHEAMLEADDLVDVNVIVLEGAGRDFCAGFDLAGIYAGRSDEDSVKEPARYRSLIGNFDDDCFQMERQQEKLRIAFDVHKPVIAKVQGNCLAGGTDLALNCDMVIASDDARIGFPATRANGMPLNHLWFYLVGPQWAKRLLLSGDCVSGRDAAKIGLVLDSVPVDDLDATVAETARRLACIDSELLSANKRIVNLGMELAGARTLQRLDAEMDARAHLSQGPRRSRFKSDMANHGLKTALTQRDEPFGDGMVRVRRGS
ncbi:crotonase/enoyl-CoA hydratase family protein [Paraburkholderia sp. MM5384-R2]|uniref:crotonase/enoyl-CoA hydratase family protein n=1 Tax=Paraburkholderia sp. MM5384-R2 TaxID=2723097 RepID=UPI0016079D5A|nr:crotonase/enoyl-CoA hydratase family protein [Paraburkholderia sp. MM5384-R2]MBB5498669.1 enoyl-CoA hydratase [Paraburkholderia sp. MM5384-R2]